MTLWALLLLSLSAIGPPAVISGFPDQKACEQAGQKINEETKRFSREFKVICVQVR